MRIQLYLTCGGSAIGGDADDENAPLIRIDFFNELAETSDEKKLEALRGALTALGWKPAEPRRFGSDELQPDDEPTRPTIVCLCGSTRFKEAFEEANYRETMAGKIVLSVGFFMHASGNKHGDGIGATPDQKIALDELHFRKIELADEILVLNVGGYIGYSTGREIFHAREHGKVIRYLEPFRVSDRGCLTCGFVYTKPGEYNPRCTSCCNREFYP